MIVEIVVERMGMPDLFQLTEVGRVVARGIAVVGQAFSQLRRVVTMECRSTSPDTALIHRVFTQAGWRIVAFRFLSRKEGKKRLRALAELRNAAAPKPTHDID